MLIAALLALVVFLLAPATGAPAAPDPEQLVKVSSSQDQAAVRAREGQGFRLVETAHFRVISDTSPRAQRVIAAQLEQFYLKVHPRFFSIEMRPVTVYLIHGGTDYARFVTARGNGEYAGAYGVYDGSTRTLYVRRCFPDGSVAGLGTLFHEAAHAMLDAEFGERPVPAWFGEGFAALFEAGRILDGQWVYGNPNPHREVALRAALDSSHPPDLVHYFRLSDSEFYAHSKVNYAVGRSMFLYLLRRHGEQTIRQFVAAMRAGRDPITALGAGWTRANLDQEWRRNVAELDFGGVYLYRGDGPNALAILTEGVAKYPGYGDLELALALENSRLGNLDQAAVHARAALRDPRCLRPFQAWSVLGYALWNKEGGAARMAFRTALKYQPWNDEVMEYEHKNLARLMKAGGDPRGAAHLREELARLQAESLPSGCPQERKLPTPGAGGSR